MISLSIKIVPRYFNVKFCQNGIAYKKDGPATVWIYAGGRRECWFYNENQHRVTGSLYD